MGWGTRAGVGAVAFGLLAGLVPGADAQQEPDPTDAAVAALRQVCDLQWVDEVCAATGYPEPQYRTDQDPNPDLPLTLRVGVLHEHSGYSDGDPDSRPSDYWTAARTGHNLADDGGDTGVIIDFLFSSEHSENEKLPITTAAACIDPSGIPAGIEALEAEGILPPLACNHVEQADHHRKWNETLAQAAEATDVSADGVHDGFTAMRGFEWTNDYFNHLGVYFSRNVVNAKIDGSYLTMDRMWSWLQEPATEGGGDDALVVFNHPGGQPALTPFDGDLPHNQVLAATLGGANWDDLAYVPAVDERVAGIEVNGGDDLAWYTKALQRGWHLGPVAAEDEHQREWSTAEDGKTLLLTRGRSPRDYYYALQRHRTVAVSRAVVGGTPGTRATFPEVRFAADGASASDPTSTPLGSVLDGGSHTLQIDLARLAAGAPVVLVTDAAPAPIDLGVTGTDGALRASVPVVAPTEGEDWWFVVACPVGTTDCGRGERYDVVSAPIWVRATTPATVTATARLLRSVL